MESACGENPRLYPRSLSLPRRIHGAPEKILKIYRTRVVDAPGSRMPGEVEIDGEEITVAASEGGLRLLSSNKKVAGA